MCCGLHSPQRPNSASYPRSTPVLGPRPSAARALRALPSLTVSDSFQAPTTAVAHQLCSAVAAVCPPLSTPTPPPHPSSSRSPRAPPPQAPCGLIQSNVHIFQSRRLWPTCRQLVAHKLFLYTHGHGSRSKSPSKSASHPKPERACWISNV